MQRALRPLLASLLLITVPSVALGDRPAPTKHSILVVIGAAGEAEYGELFQDWADQWRRIAKLAQADISVLGESADGSNDRELVAAALRQQADAPCDIFWLVLLGHGTFDGHAAKFNLRGADFTAEELGGWLDPISSRMVLINCASSSAPFINALSGEGRIVITAAKSGYELNFARFGQYLVDAFADSSADLDKDDQVSLLEAYLTACGRVAEFYDGEARLATEHALIDDNGDGLGTPANWFRGLRATQQAKEGAELDGARAHQVHLIASDRESRMSAAARQRRDALELELAALRDRKADLEEQTYFRELESILVQLARIYQDVQDGESTAGSGTEKVAQ